MYCRVVELRCDDMVTRCSRSESLGAYFTDLKIVLAERALRVERGVHREHAGSGFSPGAHARSNALLQNS